MTVDQLKAAVCRAIDDHAQKIIDLGESIFRAPLTKESYLALLDQQGGRK